MSSEQGYILAILLILVYNFTMEKFVFSAGELPTPNDQLLQSVADGWTHLGESLIHDTRVIGSIVQDAIMHGGRANWVVPAEQALMEHAPDTYYAVEALRKSLMHLEGRAVAWLQPHQPFEVRESVPEKILEHAVEDGRHVIIPNLKLSDTAPSYRIYDRISGILVATDAGFDFNQHNLGARLTLDIDGRRQPAQQLSELQEISLV